MKLGPTKENKMSHETELLLKDILFMLFDGFIIFWQDVASSIMAFSQQGSRAVCILSANGAICNATLRQPATFGGTVTYEVWWNGAFSAISNLSFRLSAYCLHYILYYCILLKFQWLLSHICFV